MIPEDIFFTNEFTEAAKLEDSHETSAGLVSKAFNQVVFSLKVYILVLIHMQGPLVIF